MWRGMGEGLMRSERRILAGRKVVEIVVGKGMDGEG